MRRPRRRESQAVTLRGSNTQLAAKPKRATPVRTAAAPYAKPHEAVPAKPQAVAKRPPAPAPSVQQAHKDTQPAPELRTAYSTPQASEGTCCRAPSRWFRRARSRAVGPRCAEPRNLNPGRTTHGRFVYVLGTRTKTRHLTYVGWTSDVARRLKQHNSGKGARTTRGRVWVLLHWNGFQRSAKP